jgi:hypothetical protein
VVQVLVDAGADRKVQMKVRLIIFIVMVAGCRFARWKAATVKNNAC